MVRCPLTFGCIVYHVIAWEISVSAKALFILVVAVCFKTPGVMQPKRINQTQHIFDADAP